MIAKQRLTIGCLSVSAVVLVVGVLILGALETRRAEASDMLSTAGSYTLLTGADGPSTDLVYLIDTKTEKLVVYKLDETRHVLVRTHVIALDDPGQDDQQKRRKLRP